MDKINIFSTFFSSPYLQRPVPGGELISVLRASNLILKTYLPTGKASEAAYCIDPVVCSQTAD